MVYPVTSIQRFSTQDGPGIRTTVFFKGCPLRCKWCHNPETQSCRQQIFFTERNCIGCRACAAVCKNSAHYWDKNNGHRFERAKCSACLSCVNVCPANAVEAVSRPLSADEIMEAVLKDMDFYGSAGGITLSGGEPLLYAEGCIHLIRMAKQAGLTTAIETCGYFDEAFLEEIARYTDLFLWDFKDGNAQRHLEYTGVSNEKISRNLFLADSFGVKIRLRCIMVRGVNMDECNFAAIAETVSRLKHCEGVELLPYHAFGGAKYIQLGLPDNSPKEWVPAQEDMLAARKRLEALGVHIAE